MLTEDLPDLQPNAMAESPEQLDKTEIIAYFLRTDSSTASWVRSRSDEIFICVHFLSADKSRPSFIKFVLHIHDASRLKDRMALWVLIQSTACFELSKAYVTQTLLGHILDCQQELKGTWKLHIMVSWLGW